VDEYGRLREIFRDAQGTIYGPGYMISEIPLLSSGERRAPTFYNSFGDIFGWSCVTITASLLIARIARRKKQAESPK
jgi:hypothetical protein